MPTQKKFLDANGVSYLASLLDNYPDNEILGTVISAIQDALSEKNDILGLNDCFYNKEKAMYGGYASSNYLKKI